MKFEVDGGPADSPTRKHIESTKIFPLISYSHKLPYLKDRTFFFFFFFFFFKEIFVYKNWTNGSKYKKEKVKQRKGKREGLISQILR